MSGRTKGALLTAAGLAVVVVGHPPYPVPYVFESVGMALLLPMVATTLTVAGGILVALDGTARTEPRGMSFAVGLAPLWCVSLVAVYLAGIAGFGFSSPLVLFSLALGLVAGLVTTVVR